MKTRTYLVAGLIGMLVFVAPLTARFATGNFHAVIPGKLYRSAQLDEKQLEEIIRLHGIQSLINLRGMNAEANWYQHQRKIVKEHHLTQHDFRLNAFESPDPAVLRELIQALIEAKKPILVHCREGADRAGLASALMLLAQANSRMEEAREQISPYFGVIRSDSAGKLVLDQYESWLRLSGKEHTPDRLIAWIRDEYEDQNGSLRFYLDGVNDDTGSSNERIFRVRGNGIRVWGWAFDARRQDKLKQITVFLDDKALPQRHYWIPRPDVNQVFGIPNIPDPGWIVQSYVNGWPRTCYSVSLRMVRLNGSEWQSPSLARICLE